MVPWATPGGSVQIGLDIGGTFTDIVALAHDGRLALTKVPSTPKDLLDGIGVAVRTILAIAGAKPGDVERFIHGTTVATNAILEQKGAVTAILTTEGFEDVLELGRMKRSRDRKSTRLNSSHLGISYAVFCLKK